MVPEVALSAIPGAVVLGLAVHALARWTVQRWQSGDWFPAVLLGCLIAILVVVLVAVTRRRRLARFTVYVVCGTGLLVYLLTTFGFTVPASWLP